MASSSARESTSPDNGRDRTLSVLIRTFGGYRINLSLLVILGIIGAALDGIGISLIIPFVSFLTDGSAAGPVDFVTQAVRAAFLFVGIPFQFRTLLAFMAGIFMLRAVALIVFSYVRARISADFMGREMGYLFSRTLEAKWPFLLSQEGGYLQNTLFWDVKRSANLLDVIAQAAQSWTGCIVYLGAAFLISPTITTLTIVAGAVFLLLFRPLVQKTRTLAEETSKNEKQFSQHLMEHLGGLKNIKVYGREIAVYETGRVYLGRLQDAFARSALVQSLGTVLIQPFSFLFMLVLFAVSYATGSFNLASFAATLYLIQKIFTYLQSGQASFHSISELVPFAANIAAFKERLQEAREEKILSGAPFAYERSIGFRDVSFRYGNGAPVLTDMTFDIAKGSVVALVGPSGGGKTSIADLFLRLFVPAEGSLYVDDVPAEDIDIGLWRAHVSYVTQESFVRNVTIRENIRFYRQELTDARIETAAQQANIHDVILGLPDGYDTIVGDRGVMLSGGQRQRIMLARALAGDPELLVLDEATSALDAESERLIHEAIRELRGRVTVLMIAHRLTTVLDADTVLVLEGGRIVEQGSPAQMLENPASYLSRHSALPAQR